jgi:hemoglobin
MGHAHAGRRVTDAAFEAIVGHLVSTLEELEVPQEVIDQITTAVSPLRFEIVSA